MEYHADVCVCVAFLVHFFSTVLFYHNGILFLHLEKEGRKRKGEDDREGGTSQFCLFSFAKPMDKSSLASIFLSLNDSHRQHHLVLSLKSAGS